MMRRGVFHSCCSSLRILRTRHNYNRQHKQARLQSPSKAVRQFFALRVRVEQHKEMKLINSTFGRTGARLLCV